MKDKDLLKLLKKNGWQLARISNHFCILFQYDYTVFISSGSWKIQSFNSFQLPI